VAGWCELFFYLGFYFGFFIFGLSSFILGHDESRASFFYFHGISRAQSFFFIEQSSWSAWWFLFLLRFTRMC
jgi:hypothetical protein